MSALMDMLDATAPAALFRPRTVTLKKRTAADATFADVRFRVMSQLNDGTPFYWYCRRQNGTTPNGGVAGGARFFGAYLDRGNTDVTAQDLLFAGTMELVLTWKRLPGDSMGQTGTAHGHESVAWDSTPVVTVDGVTVDYGGAAIDTVWTGEVITVSFAYKVSFADDSAEGASIQRTLRFTREGCEIRQTRTLLVDAYFGDSEYHGMGTCQNTEFAAPRATFDAIAIDTVTGGTGVALGGAGGGYEYPRTGGAAFYGAGYVGAVCLAGEIPTARQANGVAGYLDDRSASDNLLKWYHVVTDGLTAGTLYPAGDSVTTVARWQVWKETPEIVANLDAWSAGTYVPNTTTAAAIRDKMIETVAALAPAAHAQVRYRFPADDDGDFRLWAEANAAAALRSFVVQETGPIRPPVVSDQIREWCDEEFECVVAYPLDQRNRFGAKSYRALMDVVKADQRQIEHAIGTNGYQTINVAAGGAAVVTNGEWRVERGDACVYSVLPLQVGYWRSMS